MIKNISFSLVSIIFLVLLVPFAAPWVGLASFQDAAHQPGKMVKVGDGSLNVKVSQASKLKNGTAILIHGNPGSLDMMRPLAAALTDQGYDVISYDRMGWGHSNQRPVDIPANPTQHAKDLVDLARALELQQPLLVGYSYGGGVAMEANVLAPELFPELRLIASVGHSTQRRGSGSSLLSSPLVLRWAFGMDILAEPIAERVFASLEYPERMAAEDKRSLLASLALPGVPTNWRRENTERYHEFDNYQPHSVSACTLVMHGVEDQIVSIDTARYLADTIADAHLVEIDQTGHAIVITRAEQLAELIARFPAGCRS